MKYKALLALLLLSSLVFVGPACHRASYGADDKSKIHVGIVFDIGGKDDRSFNAAAWAGVKCAETGTLPDGKTSCGKPALDIVLRDVEPGNPTSIEPAMRAFADPCVIHLHGSRRSLCASCSVSHLSSTARLFLGLRGLFQHSACELRYILGRTFTVATIHTMRLSTDV